MCILFVAAGLAVSTAIKCYECTSGSVGVPGFGGRGERGSLRLGYLEASEFLGKLNGFPTSSLVLKAGN